MANLGMIDERERLIAQNTPVTGHFIQVVEVDADYVAEMVRQEMVERLVTALQRRLCRLHNRRG